MKIAAVETFVVANPPPHFGGLYWVFLKDRKSTRLNSSHRL